MVIQFIIEVIKTDTRTSILKMLQWQQISFETRAPDGKSVIKTRLYNCCINAFKGMANQNFHVVFLYIIGKITQKRTLFCKFHVFIESRTLLFLC